MAEDLASTGHSLWRNFLEPQSLRADLERLRARGQFHVAGVGRGLNSRPGGEVRRDETCWLERDQPGAALAQGELFSALQQLRTALNRYLYLGLVDFEGHYAVYPTEGFYRRHLDCFRNGGGSDDERCVSLVLYLNSDWQPADGGRLRLYGRDGVTFTDIDPVGGTLVCFMSRETEHEVLLNHRERFSFVGWFKVRPLHDV